MNKIIMALSVIVMLSGCHHSKMPRSLHHGSPSPEELILGALLMSGVVAVEIADEVIKEKTKCDAMADCPDGYYCNYSKHNCDKY